MLWSSISIVAALASLANGQDLNDAFSPPKYPSPWARDDPDGWTDAYAKAVQFVSQLTLLEKVNLTTGVGWEGGDCVGNTGSIPRINFPGLCLQDSPLGVRDSKFSLPKTQFGPHRLDSRRKFCIPSWRERCCNMEYPSFENSRQCNGFGAPW
jgi:hypothetical protein